MRRSCRSSGRLRGFARIKYVHPADTLHPSKNEKPRQRRQQTICHHPIHHPWQRSKQASKT